MTDFELLHQYVADRSQDAFAELVRRSHAKRACAHAAAPPHDPEWKEVEQELDEAMSHLREQTRGVLVLRFFEGKTAREVGEQLGISEEAARSASAAPSMSCANASPAAAFS